MKIVNVHEAKTHLSRLLKGVTRGNEVIIARGGKPIARLLPLERARRLPVLGADRGKFTVPEDFYAPLPEAVLAAFEGKSRQR